MRERKTKRFRELLAQYESMTRRKKASTCFFFTDLMPNAKNFADWTVIYRYGGDTVRKDALWKMKLNAICGRSRSEIQLNILELFLVIDEADKEEILKRYLLRFHQKQDFLFVLDESDWDNYKFREYVDAEAKEYGIDIDFFEGEDKRLKKLDELMKLSTFNPPAWA